jgi:2Fe-2S ferredoxin
MNNITLYITDKNNENHIVEVPSDLGISLGEYLSKNGFISENTCGGICECSFCHIIVKSDNKIKEIDILEDMMLDTINRVTTSRLSCQIALKENLDGFKFKIPLE